MISSNRLLRSLLALAAVAAEVAAQNASIPHDRRAELTQLSQRLVAGDASAIDDLLACTKPSSPNGTPSSADIERLRAEVESLRAAAPSPLPVHAAEEAHSTVQHDARAALREARAWLRAGDPNHCLKALPKIEVASGSSPLDASDGEALYRRACALERLGRDEEALDAYRRVAASAASPFLKLSAASGVDHVEWRLRRGGAQEVKP